MKANIRVTCTNCYSKFSKLTSLRNTFTTQFLKNISPNKFSITLIGSTDYMDLQSKSNFSFSPQFYYENKIA